MMLGTCLWTFGVLCIVGIQHTVEAQDRDEDSTWCRDVGEFIFMIDGSDNIRGVNFDQEKQFVLSVVDNMYLNENNGMRVAGLAFGTKVQAIRFRPFLDNAAFRSTFGALNQENGYTFTHKGIKYAREVFRNEARSGVPKTLVILTNRFSRHSKSTIAQAEEAKKEGITIVAIGIRRPGTGIFSRLKEELESIASSKNLVYFRPNFSRLQLLVTDFTETLCDIVAAAITSLPNTGSPAEISCRFPGEVMFMVDGSDSMLGVNFEQEKDFVLSVVNRLNVDEVNGARVGGLAFSTRLHGIPLASFQNVDQFGRAFRALIQDLDATYTDLGIEYARNIFYSQGRPGSSKVLVILTDGISRRPELTEQQAEWAKTQGISIVAVGIGAGKGLGGVSWEAELQSIASNSDLVYPLQDFNQLPTILNSVTSAVCDGVLITTADAEKEALELPPESPQESEFISDAFTENQLNEEDLLNEMNQLGMQEDSASKNNDDTDLPEWEQELQKELQEYEVVNEDLDDEDLENEILQQLEEEVKKG